MDPDRRKDSGEMYSPDDQGEYTSLDETPQFSLQGLSNTLADIREGTGKTSVEEYALTLEVTMADHPGRPRPSAFSWNAGMVMHILKSDLVLRELEHVQVDGPGTAYLFFYDKQGHQGLEQDAVDAVQTHMEEAFSEWISCSAHFNISLLPLMEAWWWSIAASNRRRLRSRAENPAHNAPVRATWESDSSSQLVGSAPQQDGRTSGMGERTEARLATHTGTARPHGLQSAEGIHLLPPQTGEHQTLMDTPLQVRLRATGIGTEATEGIGSRNGWHPQGWICRSLSRPIQGQR